MTKMKSRPVVARVRLSQTTVVRPAGRMRFPEFAFALESIRPWVGFGEAVRIVERTFGI